MRLYAPLVVVAVALSGCVPISHDLRNPQTGETATCTWWTPIYGDFSPSPDGSYCKCVSSHSATGYQMVNNPGWASCKVRFSSPPSN
jgi:hypothetical protein